MCACFGMLRPYVVFWHAQPAPSLVNSEVNHLMVEVEYEGLLVESLSTSGVSGWVENSVVVIQPIMFVFFRPLASARVWFFVIDGLRALFLPVHVTVSAHWFPLLEFLSGAHMVSAAGETVYVLLVYVYSAALMAAPFHAALGGLAHVFFFVKDFPPLCFQDPCAAMRAAACAAYFAASTLRDQVLVCRSAAAAWFSIPGLCPPLFRYVECWVASWKGPCVLQS